MRRSPRIWAAWAAPSQFLHHEPRSRKERKRFTLGVCAPRRAGSVPVSDITPTRAVALELQDEQRAMHEGYVFLDEKCLLLAGEILRELGRYAALGGDAGGGRTTPPSPRCGPRLRGTASKDLQVYPPGWRSTRTLR